jgi:hypothetical protein
MENIRSIPSEKIKLYHINFKNLTKLYMKYYGDYDFIADCIERVSVPSQNQKVLPRHNYYDDHIRFEVTDDSSRTRVLAVFCCKGYKPMYDKTGTTVYVVTTPVGRSQMKFNELSQIILESASSDVRHFMVYKLLSVIKEEDLHSLIHSSSGEIKISKDIYEHLYETEANPLPEFSKPDFALECNDKKNVYIHKFLICRYSPVINAFVSDFTPAPTSYPEFPFSSDIARRFVESFYRQRVNIFQEADLLVVYDYLQIIDNTQIIDRYARLLGYAKPVNPTQPSSSESNSGSST